MPCPHAPPLRIVHTRLAPQCRARQRASSARCGVLRAQPPTWHRSLLVRTSSHAPPADSTLHILCIAPRLPRALRRRPSHLNSILALHHGPTLVLLIIQRSIAPRHQAQGRVQSHHRDPNRDVLHRRIAASLSSPTPPQPTSTDAAPPTDLSQPERVAWAPAALRFVGFTALWGHPERGIRRCAVYRKWCAMCLIFFLWCGALTQMPSRRLMRKANWFAGRWTDEINMGILAAEVGLAHVAHAHAARAPIRRRQQVHGARRLPGPCADARTRLTCASGGGAKPQPNEAFRESCTVGRSRAITKRGETLGERIGSRGWTLRRVKARPRRCVAAARWIYEGSIAGPSI